MKFDRVFLIVFNILSRLFGVLAILVGIVFLVSAYAMKDNQVRDFLIGLVVIVMGVAFLVTKSVNAEQLARLRRRMGRLGLPKSGR
jgi:uncharacterized membrane protein HdeD (DUF308 family)